MERFIQLEPSLKKGDDEDLKNNNSKTITLDPDVHEKLMTIKVPYSQITKCSELKENPFRKRICKIFSTDGSGNMSFNDFMLLFSSLCERSPRDIKLHYAFSIYDFDGDNFIGISDIEQVRISRLFFIKEKKNILQATRLLTQGQMSEEEVEQIWRKVLEETDIDDDKKLSNNEFTHVINKSPDFLTTFNVRI